MKSGVSVILFTQNLIDLRPTSPLEQSRKMSFFRQLLWLVLCLFFRKIEVKGREHIPMDKPVIFTPNHQNAFLDAILTGVMGIRQPYFLARGDIFQTKWAGYLLRGIHIWPIFRAMDGLNQLGKNQAIFESVGELLKQQASVLVFPEATHQMGYRLLPVRKGFARIAMGSEAETGFQLDTRIVPVTLHYEMHPYADKSVFIQFGEPLATQTFEAAYRENPQKGLNAFRIALDQQMRSMLVDWDQEDEKAPFRILKLIFGPSDALGKRSPQALYQQDQQLKKQLDGLDREVLTQHTEKLMTVSEQLGIHDLDLLYYSQNEKLPLGRLIWTAIPAGYAWLNHFPFLKIVQKIVNLFEDTTFHASLKFAAGLLLIPLTYLIQILVVSGIAGWHPWGWIYALSLPISGFILLRNNRYWQKVRSKLRFARMKKRQPALWENFEKSIDDLKNLRTKIYHPTVK
jgi:1-acyl-sn-glycerol-3-phosphate acyltransferase